MNAIFEALSHTPWWVYVLFIVLVRRGIVASRPSVAPLWRLGIVPAGFALWDIADMLAPMPIGVGVIFFWLVLLALGAALGHWLVRDTSVRADHDKGLIALQGDPTYLPLVLAIFAVKYAFGYMAGAYPAYRADATFILAHIGVGGFCTGLFVGRFATYALKYRAAPNEALGLTAAADGLPSR